MDVNETEGALELGKHAVYQRYSAYRWRLTLFLQFGRRLDKIMWDSYTSTGLAVLRRDGFVSMHADKRKVT